MKRTVSTLALAAPLAFAALGLGATPALAEPIGPEVVTAPTGGDPDPRPEIDDKAPLPDDPSHPDGPDEITDPLPCPTHGPCGEGPGEEGEEPGDPGDETPGDKEPGDIPVPTRIDAGAGAGASDEGIDLAWLLAGGALVTASGVAFAARRARTSA
ncbi:MAG: hypothetical protein ACR2FE_05440 [Aeromicrobium sp.]